MNAHLATPEADVVAAGGDEKRDGFGNGFAAVDDCLDKLAELIKEPDQIRALLLSDAKP